MLMIGAILPPRGRRNEATAWSPKSSHSVIGEIEPVGGVSNRILVAATWGRPPSIGCAMAPTKSCWTVKATAAQNPFQKMHKTAVKKKKKQPRKEVKT
jgi:hypothetical protein